MLKCRDRGDELTCVTETDGCNGFVQNPIRTLLMSGVRVERAEATSIRSPKCALAFELRAETIDIGELDEFLFDTAEVRLKLIEAIRTSRAGGAFPRRVIL